jgi:hypothetical protein
MIIKQRFSKHDLLKWALLQIDTQLQVHPLTITSVSYQSTLAAAKQQHTVQIRR